VKTTGRHFFGIDLGTSSCSVAYVTDDPRQRDGKILAVQTVNATVETGGVRFTVNRVPSIVAAPLEARARGGALFGFEFHDAFRRKKKDADLLRRGRDFFTSVKSDLGTLRAYTRSRVPGCRTPAEATAIILDRLRGLARDANAALDTRKAPVVITVPASFSALARTETLDAAAAAGLDRASVRLLDEPVAALLDLLNSPDASALIDAQPRNLLVFDYGAGTCDVALLRVRFDPAAESGLHVENLAISNYHRLGGDDIDAEVMRAVVWPQICTAEQQASMTAYRRRAVEDTLTGTVARRLKEQMCADVESAVRTSSWTAVDAEPVRVLVPLERVFELPELRKSAPRHFAMDSAQFREVMAPFLSLPEEADERERSLLFPVEQTLRRAGVKPEALHAVVLHGGSSLNPYVLRLMKDTFGHHDLFRHTRVETTPDPLVSVARGAAIACYWRGARDVEIVRPIMPEDFGVVLRDDRTVPLVAAGTPLPFPDADGTADVHDDGAPFAVPADDTTTLLVPYYTGTEKEQRLAGTVKVPLPARAPAGTPVRIAVRVEEDKTLKWWFRIGDGEARIAPAVDDPWTRRALDADERRLAQVRRSIRDAMAAGRPVTQHMLADEANCLRICGEAEAALLAIEDLMADHAVIDGGTHNVHGLVLTALHRDADALQAFGRAAGALPDSAVVLGNVGIAALATGSIQAGLATLRRSADMEPASPWIYLWLGYGYRLAGDEARALTEYRRCHELLRKEVERRPFDRDAWARIVSVCQSLGDYRGADQAREVLKRIDRDALYEGDSRHVLAAASRKPVAAEAE
jgi:molecular chaperone DnaK (HSP70)